MAHGSLLLYPPHGKYKDLHLNIVAPADYSNKDKSNNKYLCSQKQYWTFFLKDSNSEFVDQTG